MGYERGGRDGARHPDEDRQLRQDYDRSYGNRSYGDAGRDAYGRHDDARADNRFGRPDDARARGARYAPRADDRDYADRERGGYGRQPQGYDYDDRGFFDRAGDEVRSWFGDEDAERRRRLDERYGEREQRYDRGSSGGDTLRGSTPGGYTGVGDYGAGRGAGATGSFGLGAGNDRQSWGQDPNYHSWRSRQIEQFDRDYEDYRREHQSKFDAEFHGWRSSRQTQRDALGRVREHQEVVGSDGGHVGTVDKVRGDTIILTRKDQDAGGRHHAIPSSWITSVDEKVTISKTADDAHAHWRDAERTSAFWGDDAGRSGAKGNAAQTATTTPATAADQTRTPGQTS